MYRHWGTIVGATIYFAASSFAFGQELTIATYGGSWMDDVRVCHVEPFEAETGVKVTIKPGNSAEFAVALRSGAGSSGIDVVTLEDPVNIQVKSEGLLETLDRSKLPKAAGLDERHWDKDNTYVRYLLGLTTLVYNPDLVKPAPTSWNDLFDPKYTGKISIGDIGQVSSRHLLMFFNEQGGGTGEDITPGITKMNELARNSITLYTQADQLISLFDREEIVLSAWYPNRAASAAEKGAKLAVAYPKEGAIGGLSTLSIPKGSQHPDLAHKFIDIALSEEGQKCFTDRQFVVPIRPVEASETAAKYLPTKEEMARVQYLDYAAAAAHFADWARRWQREVGR